MKNACLIAGILYIPFIHIVSSFFRTKLLQGIRGSVKNTATPRLEHENLISIFKAQPFQRVNLIRFVEKNTNSKNLTQVGML